VKSEGANAMATTVTPFLMFQGNAKDAMAFYVSLFPDAKIIDMVEYGPGEAGREGSLRDARFSVGGQIFRCTDSVVKHDFSFTPAFSLFVECVSEAQIARVYADLSEGGTVFMLLGEYGFSRRFAWLNDRYGVSWQLNLQ